MAVTSAQVSVTNAATQLVAAPVPLAANYTYAETAEANLRYVVITTGSGAVIFVGGANVTALTGLQLGTSTTLASVIPLRPTEALYAITASSSSTVSVLVAGN